MNPCTPRESDATTRASASPDRAAVPPGSPDVDAGPASAPASPKRKSSRVARWRALVLVLVQVAIALHVAHWLQSGTTLSPLEPSESMQFTADGLVNAGAIFFALTILSTAILGRFFCGWACHIVALQDACAWLMQKIGVRPRLVNLGILWTVPWITFAYMFLHPIVRRLVEGQSFPVVRTKLHTDSFWATFPAWPMAIVTVIVVGFVVVYFLGSKAYCNYGCPYGAIFGIADQLAPVRIRVTDACAGCGHCTAACTSNVRVHEEVREWKAVVDPGCMKCLDCVSVCPTNALYVGFGMPAIATTRRAPPKRAAPAEAASSEVKRQVLLAFFYVAVFAILTMYNGAVEAYVNPPEWITIGVLAALSLAVGFVFRGKARRSAEYTLGEEVVMAVAFLVAALAFRGLGYVPLLLAMGLAFLFAWGCVTIVRLSKRVDVRGAHGPLKVDGRFTRAGRWFAAAMFAALIALALAARAQKEAARTGRPEFARLLHDTGLAQASGGHFEPAITAFRRALAYDPSFVEARESLAGALCSLGRFDEGIREFEAALQLRPGDAATLHLLGLARLEVRDAVGAERDLREAVRIAPNRPEYRNALADALDALGRRTEAEAERRSGRTPPPSR